MVCDAVAVRHHIFLVPGFFGFANLGDLVYFAHVAEFMRETLREQGFDVDVTHAPTLPTASISERARHLHEVIEVAAPTGPIHLVAHSSGGLDVRMFLAPGFSVDGMDVESTASRCRSAVTLATPHYGTPLANYFNSLFGGRILSLLSLSTVYILRFGHLPLSFVLKLGGLIAEARARLVKRPETILDQLFSQLLSDFSDERQGALRDFLGQVRDDQSIIPQLSPESVELFNSRASDRDDVRYGCIVTRGARPTGRARLKIGPNPYKQVSFSVYRWLYRQAARMPKSRVPRLTPEQRLRLRAAFGEMPQIGDNDGIIPTLSQVWGEVIDTAVADHHDIIGHFHDTHHVPPHYDWLVTGSGFNRRHFESLWSNVAAFIAEQF